MIGRTLGHYRVVEEIGRGGMGVVYRAYDERLEREVALKVLPAGTLGDESARKRFRKEALALSKLNHPNIQTVFDFNRQDGIDFLVTEYVPGVTLSDKVRGTGLPEKEVLRLGQQLAEGLAAAHEQGIIHRDFKPSNLRVTPDGRLKILDFGVARLVRPPSETAATRSLTESYTVAGTPLYMAPEQKLGEPVDARSDIYAAGLVLREMATGQPPRPGEAPKLPGVSPRLQAILEKCLEKDAENRYQSAKELAVDLRRLAAPALEVAPRQEPRGSAWSAWRVRGVAVALIVLLALLVGLNVGELRDRLQPPLEARTLVILPMEVRGQVEGAAYAGQAFAEALAMNLTQAKDLTILPVPEPGELGEGRGLAKVKAARKVRAGLMLTGALSREREAVRARLSLVDTAENRIIWGAEEESAEGDLSHLAILLSRGLLTHLGDTTAKMYENHHYEAPSPAVGATPEFLDARTGLRNFTAPLQATQRLVERFPEDPLVRVMRADALLQAAWGAPSTSPKRTAFEESLAAVDRVDPNNPWDDMFRALYYGENDGKRREEIEVYNRLLARDDIVPGGRALILILRGQAKAALDDYEGATADMEEAIRLNPADNFVYAVFGEMLERDQRYEEAWERARQAVALNPSSPQNQQILGWTSLRLEKWEEALPALEKACQQGMPPNQWFCADWASALWRAGDHEEARRVAQQAASLPKTIFGAFSLARYYAQAGNGPVALHYLQRYLQLKPTFTPRDARYLAQEPLLEPLRGDPAFESMVAEARRRAQALR